MGAQQAVWIVVLTTGQPRELIRGRWVLSVSWVMRR